MRFIIEGEGLLMERVIRSDYDEIDDSTEDDETAIFLSHS